MALKIDKPGIRIVTAQSGRLDKGLWVKGKSILLETSEDSVRHSFTNGGLAVEQIRLTMAP